MQSQLRRSFLLSSAALGLSVCAPIGRSGSALHRRAAR